jgi:hypothetical protein
MTDEYIAEAQRLSIAQNKTLRFLYQTWWSWWLPRVGMGGFLIYCLVNHFEWSTSAILGGFLVLSFVGEWVGRRGLAKARERARFKGSTTTVSMDGNGVDTVGEAGNLHAKWLGIIPPTIYPYGVMVKFSRFAMIWLPDNALIEGSPDDVRRLLADNVKDATAANQ